MTHSRPAGQSQELSEIFDRLPKKSVTEGGSADLTSTEDTSSDVEHADTAGKSSFFTRLYTGTGAFNIVGKRKTWYVVTAVIFLICVGSMVFRGFNFGIDFAGGTRIQFPVAGAKGTITVEQAEQVYRSTLGSDVSSAQVVGSGDSASILLSSNVLSAGDVAKLKTALVTELSPQGLNGQPSQQAISDSAVSGTWGGEISQKAGIALAVFLVLVTLFLTFYFERAMAIAALVALVHDIVITAGVYSLIGFEVTPATVIGLLTILGFSLYDTVVVFDKVRENTRGLLGLTRRTYGEAANLALNQTLMRSINTSLIAVLPVLGLLVVGVGLLGVGTLKDLALVQLTGLLSGTYSSLFLATPLLVDLKMRQSAYQVQAQRVQTRRSAAAQKATAATDAPAEPATPTAKTSSRAKAAPAGHNKGRPSGKAARTTSKKQH